MKLHILCVGRLKEDAERGIVERYLQRFQQTGAPLGFGGVAITELIESKARSAPERKAAEAAELRKKIPEGARIVALDERGKTLGSAEFAQFLASARDNGIRNLCLIIGGPDGLAPDLAAEAALTLSFGRMTLPHGLARAVLAEQLYRAASILAGHPYHRV
ncbi:MULTISPECIES: 23S rRNA (pseudouridine(1915)-N(3))-methyltransferase RlmH [Rhodomicrobium]|uniref:23S rRNA (pseudouridine(1915)-N(3))-methyltransferase RlmH n=1 Tax=Rhodomicrobium TaxID=1068 RepID=UPI000B4BE608|nr:MULTISPECIES: 23S rRNA (pseudouridine(1915)-N(3))-methyltransferase RlmH [Rhodomicrobium]